MLVKKRHYHINDAKMESNNELQKTDIKNCTCYYFDNIVNINDLNLANILLEEKSYRNLLIYDVRYKTSYSAKPLCIISDKVGGYVRKYDRTKYLGLLHFDGKYENF